MAEAVGDAEEVEGDDARHIGTSSVSFGRSWKTCGSLQGNPTTVASSPRVGHFFVTRCSNHQRAADHQSDRDTNRADRDRNERNWPDRLSDDYINYHRKGRPDPRENPNRPQRGYSTERRIRELRAEARDLRDKSADETAAALDSSNPLGTLNRIERANRADLEAFELEARANRLANTGRK